MTKKANIKLKLSDEERKKLRRNKVKIKELVDFAVDEIETILAVPLSRAQEIKALAEFQMVPSIGIKFAEDLLFLGYHSLEELQAQDGAKLVEAYELKKGYWIDSCVEDQFRLVVHFANHADYTKNWWDFTAERKAYRAKNGYPANRPQAAWHEVVGINRKIKD
ncbi:MAG: helix-hairpin-helix domain-containing protein [Saprospiraceae bacterium]